jgi:hypothetical protein
MSLAEIARLLCDRGGGGESVKLFTDFLVKAATPFNPKVIARKHDLIVFCDNGLDASAQIEKGMAGSPRQSGAMAAQAGSVYIQRDFFLHFIFCTSRYRYPRIKASYRKNPFWGDSPPALPFLGK